MVDVHTKEIRSYNMSQIRYRDTKPEMRVRRVCHSLGLRYRLHRKDLPGKPDLVFARYKTVLFVHGCFWHMHSRCKDGKKAPKSNVEYWSSKREGNRKRDRKHKRELRKNGWRVLEYWECELKDLDKLKKRVSKDFCLES